MQIFSNLKGDFFGGLTASLVALPICMALGMTAFQPLGKDFVAQGVVAGLYSLLLAPFIVSLFGGSIPQIVCPTAPLAVMAGSIIATLMQQPEFSNTHLLLLFFAAIIVCSGLFQIAFVFTGAGKLIKFIPYPVVAGFMNGIALIFFLHQLKPILGVDHEQSYTAILAGQAGIHYGALLAGLATIIASLLSERWTERIPGDVIGLGVGIAVFFALGRFFDPGMLRLEDNPLIIGPIPRSLPSPKQLFAFMESGGEIPLGKWLHILIPALTLSIIAALESLLATVVVDKKTKVRHDSDREVVGQGIGNIATGLFGALPVAAALPETMVNLNNGGRTHLSGIIVSAIIAGIVLLLRPFAEWIPISVLAGILVVTAGRIFEYASLNLVKKRSTWENLGVVLIVTLITVSVDLVTAVGIGIVIAAFLFVKEQIGQTLIRRKFTGDHLHSKSVRDEGATRILEEKGNFISIYELSGSLFFGSCDKLLLEIEKDKQSRCLILDLKRVNSIDITGAQLLLQIIERLHGEGRHLLLSNLDSRLRKYMEDLHIIEAVGENQIFPDMDFALDWAENYLIQQEGHAKTKKALSLHDLSVFSSLSSAQVHSLQHYLQPIKFQAGEIVFRQGDPGDGIYFILSGQVSVVDEGQERRLASFNEGVFFGDMGLLEDKPRSATVRCDTGADLLFMSKKNFQKMLAEEPMVANAILLKISYVLANRLRVTNKEVAFLTQ